MRTAQENHQYFKRYHSILSFLSILALIIIMQSCYKERLQFDKIAGGKWSPEFAAPIAYGNLTMADIIKGSKKTWQEDPNGFLSVIYSKDEVTDIADKVIKIPNQSNDTTFNFALPPGLAVGDSVTLNQSFHSEFDGNTSNERIDSMLLKSGTLEFTISTDLNHDSYIEISIPKLTKAGVPLRKKINFQYTGGGTSTKSISINLKDYYLVLTSGTAGQANFIQQDFKILVTKKNNTDNSPYFYKVKQKISNISYYLVLGYFYQHDIEIKESSVVIDLFDEQMAGALYAEDPRLKITLHNSYGLPATMTFTELYAERDGVKMNFTGSLLPTLTVDYPNFNEIGQSKSSVFLFNSSNSNIKDIIAMNPQNLFFKGIVKTNPQGTPIDNFTLDTSHISVDLEIELPLYGHAINFVLRDTTILSGNDEDVDTKGINEVTIRLKTKNSFPTDVFVQVYMTDSLNNIIDSIFKSGSKILDAAPVSGAPDYRVTASVDNTTLVKLTQEQLDNYKKAQKMIIETRSSTTQGGTNTVKIYTDNGVYFELSAKAIYVNDF